MARGDAIIVQGALQAGRWNGRADVLRRVETPSRFGAWSYEVIDTKLARETKGNTVLQISLYSDLLSATQGVEPTSAYVVTPGTNYDAGNLSDCRLCRLLSAREGQPRALGLGYRSPSLPIPNRSSIARFVDGAVIATSGGGPTIICRSSPGSANPRSGSWRGMASRSTAALAAMPLPLQWRPDRGAAQSYEKIREQARIPGRGTDEGAVVYETLPPIAGFGLSRLPEPSAGDIFFDFEGDPFVGDGGLEFLFGYLYSDADGSALRGRLGFQLDRKKGPHSSASSTS